MVFALVINATTLLKCVVIMYTVGSTIVLGLSSMGHDAQVLITPEMLEDLSLQIANMTQSRP